MSNIPFKSGAKGKDESRKTSSRSSVGSKVEGSGKNVNAFKRVVDISRYMKKHVQDEKTVVLPATNDRREQTKIAFTKLTQSMPIVTPSSTFMQYITKTELESERYPEITNGDITIPNSIENVRLAGSLYDPLMGPYERSKKCNTCDAYGTDCPYHPGKITFKRPNDKGDLIECPIYRSSFLVDIARCLNCICQSCGRLRVPPTIAEKMGVMAYHGRHRLEAYCKLSTKTKICLRDEEKPCVVPRIYKVSNKEMIIREGIKDKTVEHIFPYQAYNIIRFLPDDEVKALGFSPTMRPEDIFIIWGILVTPPLVRPVRTVQGSKAVVNDFTERYATILKISNELKNLGNEKGDAIETLYRKARQSKNYTGDIDRHPIIESFFSDIVKRLSEQVEAMVVDRSASTSNQSKMSFDSLISKKGGYIRGSLGGGNVENSARSVIGPGYGIHIWEIGVPEEIAQHVTSEETVTDINMARCDKLLEAGKIKIVERANVKTKIMANNRSGPTKFILQVGDKIHRELMNGDIVPMNRNPSLHRQSIIGFRVRIIPQKSFRLPLPATTPLNADFDGDEMNLHVPQTEEGRAELQLMTVEASLESLSKGGPIFGLVYNALPGLYKLTGPNVVLDKVVFSDIAMYLYVADSEYGTDTYSITSKFHPTNTLSQYLFQKPDRNNFSTKTEYMKALQTNYYYRCEKNGVDPYHGRSVIGLFLPHDFNYTEKFDPPQEYYMGRYTYEKIQTYDGETITDEKLFRIEDDGSRTEIKITVYKIDPIEETKVETRDGNVVTTRFTANQYEIQNYFAIRDGILVAGTMTSQTVGVGSSVKFLTFVYRYLGSVKGLAFLNYMNMLGNYYLSVDPLTTSLLDFYDYTDGGKLRQYVDKLIDDAKEKVNLISEEIVDDPIAEERRQTAIKTHLGNIGMNVIKELTGPTGIYPGSSFQAGEASGAKGKKANLIQSAGAMGKMEILGRPMPKTLSSSRGKRITPYTTHSSKKLSTIGYVSSCLAVGMTPEEQVIVQMNSRVDVAQGKQGVPDTGYIQRKLAQLMAELIIEGDGTVRNGRLPSSKIVQYHYGDIGFDATTTFRHADAEGVFYTPWNMHQVLLNL